MDLWGGATEQKRGDALVALARLPKASAEQALAGSGTNGLFWEPVARRLGDKTYNVKWLDQLEEESEADYLRRALALKPKLGLVVGKRQLGERVLYEVADAVRSWRLAGTPREWTQDTVMELLQGTGLNNLTP